MMFTLRASVNKMPQLEIGARNPMPRKLRAVSPKIMPGIVRVAEAIRCDMKPGIMWRPMIRALPAPISRAAST